MTPAERDALHDALQRLQDTMSHVERVLARVEGLTARVDHLEATERARGWTAVPELRVHWPWRWGR